MKGMVYDFNDLNRGVFAIEQSSLFDKGATTFTTLFLEKAATTLTTLFVAIKKPSFRANGSLAIAGLESDSSSR